MTRDEVIRLARESGMGRLHPEEFNMVGEDEVFRFAELVAKAEREAIAQFIEQGYVRQFEEPWRDNLAKAVRARSQHD